MEATSEYVICQSCGLVNEEAATAIALLERERNQQRARIARLESQRVKALTAHPRYADALDVLEYWRQVCAPNARELNGKRLVNCLARLEHYDAATLKTAVHGYARFPYATRRGRSPVGAGNEWQADAEQIFRDAGWVDRGVRLAHQGNWIDTRILAGVHWSKVKAANRKAIMAYLRERFGEPLEDSQGTLLWPCPRCQADDRSGAGLRVTLDDFRWLAQCSLCELTDTQLLELAVPPPPEPLMPDLDQLSLM